jgi:hypothetical protein
LKHLGGLLGQSGHGLAISAPIPSRLIPIRNLNADEDADNDNDKIKPNREPVLGINVLSDAAEDHGATTSLTISTELANKSAAKQKALYIFITSNLP